MCVFSLLLLFFFGGGGGGGGQKNEYFWGMPYRIRIFLGGCKNFKVLDIPDIFGGKQ